MTRYIGISIVFFLILLLVGSIKFYNVSHAEVISQSLPTQYVGDVQGGSIYKVFLQGDECYLYQDSISSSLACKFISL